MTSIPPYAFSRKIRIVPSNIDEMHHVNNVVYSQWIQDISEAHWKETTTPEIRKDIAWVVRRHEIDFLQSVVMGDELTAYTWPEMPEGLKVIRNVVVINDRTHKKVMTSRTLWILLDLKRMRPIPVPKHIVELFR